MKRYTRFLAFFLSLVMLVSLLPVSTVNASATEKEEYNFEANSLTASADKESMAEGSIAEAPFFSVIGTVKMRWKEDKGVTSVEVEKACGSAIAFTLSGTAKVEVAMSSNGGSNTSAVGIINADDELMSNAEGIVAVTGTNKTTLTYNLDAGTYRVVSPTDEAHNRGARVYSIEVTMLESADKPQYSVIEGNSSATATISTGGQIAYFRYDPKKAATITFYSTGTLDTYGYILDASGNTLSSNDDGGSGYNFSMTYEVSAGTTYYLAARYLDSAQTGTINVYLSEQERVENTDKALNVSGGTQTYTLFNSGRSGSASYYSSSKNPAANTLTNNGYDIYATTSYTSMRTVQLGLPFTIEAAVLEQATLSIYAYDVDESYGERDYVYLYDETTGEKVMLDGYLSGMDSQWNTTVFKVDPSLFEIGHTYHFLLNVAVSGWVVYVRNVAIELPCGGSADERFILSSDFSASIDANGMVSTSLSLATAQDASLSLEYAATYDSIRYGATTATFNTTTETTQKDVSFYLQSGAPKGTYSINVIVKRANGSIVTTFTTVASTVDVCSVSYNANGGSQNLPHDSNAYTAGTWARVLFTYIPSREGYVFLGWARDRNASVAEFTQEEGASFQIFADTTLYAVWGLEHAQHTPGAFVVDTEPDCVNGGSGHTICAECGETISTAYIPATGHSYAMTESIPATCTQSGSITYTCANCGDSYAITIYADHCYEVQQTQAASCTEAGYKLFVCSECGATYTEQIPAGQHNYVSELVEQATTEHGGLLRYTCDNCGDSYDITTPALKAGVNVLLVQDRNAWETRTNLTVLNKLVEDGYIAGWNLSSSAQLSQLDLTVYGVVLIADDQYASTYQSLAAVNEQLTGYVQAGGVLIYGACDNGWTNGNIDYALPGGTRKGNYYSAYNYIVDAVHPIVTAALTDGKGLTNELLHHNYCSHTYFTDLPENAKIILQDSLGMPTLAEYALGKGSVIVNGLTWEHAYEYLTYFGSFSYSTTAFDDMIVYAATLANGHTHAYDAGVEVQPTCTEKGYTLHTCSECGMTYRDNFVDALGHTPGEWTRLREASCTQSGVLAQSCSVCGEIVDSENLPATSHAYAYSMTVEPDCDNDGYVLYVCTNEGCGSEKRDCLPALGHDYGDDNICDRCGHTLPYIHNHKYTDTVVEPTCSEMGYTLHSCPCGASYRDMYIEPNGHRWDEGVVTNEQSCVLDGTMLYTCTLCGQTRTQSIPAAHDWTESLIADATCTQDGEKKLVCKRCGEEQQQIIPAGHRWDEGVVTKAPTCSEEGTKECSCSVCDSSEEQTIAALGHEFYCGVCTRCGIKFIDIVNDDLAHPEYGMYFELDEVISNYGPALVNEYGVLLNYNTDAQLDKVAVYLTQDGTMWRRCIACTGSGIEFATYVPYLSYNEDIKYSGLNSQWINTFSLRPNADGIWNYSDYATIGVNLEDQYGQLLLSLYSIGNAGAKTRVFDDLDEMIAWLSPQTQHEHSAGEWEPASVVDGKVTQIKRACTQCGETLQYQNVKAEFYTSEASGRYQDSISLDIYVKAGSYLADMQMNFGYDSDMFEVESVEFAAELPGLQMATVDPDTQQIRLIYSGTACLTEDTRLATVHLKIKANVAYRTQKAIWLDSTAYNICHALLGKTTYELDIEICSGFGNVSILGIDPNGDGELNIFDLYAMLMALSSPDYACDDAQLVATMDCNGDGIFDVADLTYLQQMIVDMG